MKEVTISLCKNCRQPIRTPKRFKWYHADGWWHCKGQYQVFAEPCDPLTMLLMENES